jgi:CheY-like chemotaxis protein
MSPLIAVAENIAQTRQMDDAAPTLPWSSCADFFTSRVNDQRLVNRPFLIYYDDDRPLQCTYSDAEFDTEGVHEIRRRLQSIDNAPCGKDAIAVFQKERPNLTILDIDMPDIDGITVLRQIRTIDPHAKVMVFTGGDSPSVEREARALGVTDFLQKGLALPSLSELESRGWPPAVPQAAPSPTAPLLPSKD